MTAEGEFPKTDGDVLYSSEINAMPPVGSVMAWHKTLTGTPALPTNWVECSGQVISDATSVYDGETIPDMNGNGARVIGNAASGTYTSVANVSVGNSSRCCSNPNVGTRPISVSIPTYTMVWIIKIK